MKTLLTVLEDIAVLFFIVAAFLLGMAIQAMQTTERHDPEVMTLQEVDYGK